MILKLTSRVSDSPTVLDWTPAQASVAFSLPFGLGASAGDLLRRSRVVVSER